MILPLMINDELFGFIQLEQPQITHTLDIEDIDLLNTVTSHVTLALFLNQADTQLQLAH